MIHGVSHRLGFGENKMPLKDLGLRRQYGQNYHIKHRAETSIKRRAYYLANKETILAKHRQYAKQPHRKAADTQRALEWRHRERGQVFEHYGAKCTCCGETHNEFLCIDHIHGGGKAHRASIGGSGSAVYHWIIGHNFPPDFQVLCWNCNHAKSAHPEGCPHQRDRGDLMIEEKK